MTQAPDRISIEDVEQACRSLDVRIAPETYAENTRTRGTCLACPVGALWLNSQIPEDAEDRPREARRLIERVGQEIRDNHNAPSIRARCERWAFDVYGKAYVLGFITGFDSASSDKPPETFSLRRFDVREIKISEARALRTRYRRGVTDGADAYQALSAIPSVWKPTRYRV